MENGQRISNEMVGKFIYKLRELFLKELLKEYPERVFGEIYIVFDERSF